MILRYVMVLCIGCTGPFLFAQFDSLSQHLETVEVVGGLSNGNLSVIDNAVTVSRALLNTTAGAFDDPTRLLIKAAATSTTNDQANSIIYRGLPAHFVQWLVNGVEVVNPNHLSNAGTSQDYGSAASGGVNMIAGQILSGGAFTPAFQQPQINALAGQVSLQVDSFPSYIQASLIGFEGGLTLNGFSGGYRYSFTGLLADMGVDFGGEAIKFQDLNLGYNKTLTNGSRIGIHFVWGKSTNELSPTGDLEAERPYKDTYYESQGVITTLNYKTEAWDINLGYSQRSNQHFTTDSIVITPMLNQSYQESSEFFHNKVALNLTHSSSSPWKYGLRSSLDFHDYLISREGRDLARINQRVVLLNTPFISYQRQFSSSLFTEFMVSPTLYNVKDFSPNFNIWTGIRLSSKSQLGLSIAHVSQSQDALVLSKVADDADVLSKALQYELSYVSTNSRLGRIKFSLFNYQIRDLPSDINGFVSVNQFNTVPVDSLDQLEKAVTYGVSLTYEKSWSNLLKFSLNASWVDSKYSFLGQWFSGSYDFGHMTNMQVQKAWRMADQKYFRIHTALHLRGGAWIFPLDETVATSYNYLRGPSDQLNSFFRLDLRLIYQIPNTTWSLDLQNVTNHTNPSFNYRRIDNGAIAIQNQLGLIPVLAYRRTF